MREFGQERWVALKTMPYDRLRLELHWFIHHLSIEFVQGGCYPRSINQIGKRKIACLEHTAIWPLETGPTLGHPTSVNRIWTLTMSSNIYHSSLAKNDWWTSIHCRMMARRELAKPTSPSHHHNRCTLFYIPGWLLKTWWNTMQPFLEAMFETKNRCLADFEDTTNHGARFRKYV